MGGEQPVSDRHPGGWAAVPLALLLDLEAPFGPGHVAVYAAIASDVDGVTGRSRVLGTRRRRLMERARIRDEETLRGIIGDLIQAGYVAEERRAGNSSIFVILPTPPGVLDRLRADREQDEAATPESSGARGGTARVPRSTPGGRPRSTQGTPPRSTRGTPQSLEEGKIEDAGGTPTESRPPRPTQGTLDDRVKTERLARAVGRRNAVAAIEEVRHRLAHPDPNHPTLTAWGLARTIGDCYTDRASHRERCRSLIHGPAALQDHALTRREHDHDRRKALTNTNPDADLDANKARQIDALRSEANHRKEANTV